MRDDIRIVAESISMTDVSGLCERHFGDMVKAVIDVRREILALGGELHADVEQVLLDEGSVQLSVPESRKS